MIATGRMNGEQAARLVAAMRNAFPEAMVTGHEELTGSMPNHEKDRYVLAAAVKAGARVVVTRNLRDFHPMPQGVEAHSPDDFLLDLFDLAPREMVGLLRQQAAALKRPAERFGPHRLSDACPARMVLDLAQYSNSRFWARASKSARAFSTGLSSWST